MRADQGIELIKGKVGKIEEDAQTKDLLVTVEDVVGGKRMTRAYSMVVLATGIVPETSGVASWLKPDEFGFLTGNDGTGVFGAGCVKLRRRSPPRYAMPPVYLSRRYRLLWGPHTMDKKLGVYICSGCSIGESSMPSNWHAWPRRNTSPPSAALMPSCAAMRASRSSAPMWSRERPIPWCSPPVRRGPSSTRFAFDSSVLVERVNLREQVAWSHEPKNEDTQALAEDQLRMGIVRANKMEPQEPLSDAISRAVLVVGGGVTGYPGGIGCGRNRIRRRAGGKGSKAWRLPGGGEKDVPYQSSVHRCVGEWILGQAFRPSSPIPASKCTAPPRSWRPPASRACST